MTFKPIIIDINEGAMLGSLSIPELKQRFNSGRALLFRGFETDQSIFSGFTEKLGKDFMSYQGGAFERKSVSNSKTLMTVTGEGQTFGVPLHGEMYYSSKRPKVLWFYCEKAPSADGETTICDANEFYLNLSESTRTLFETQKINYIRRYEREQWKAIFQTDNTAKIEAYCNDSNLSHHFPETNLLETSFETDAIVKNADQKPCFINNIMPVLTQELAWKRQTSIVRLSDGSPIPSDVYEELMALSKKLVYEHSWQDGDIVMIDNRYLMHGRNEISDQNRKILVRLSDYES